jgi:hypothetical protein
VQAVSRYLGNAAGQLLITQSERRHRTIGRYLLQLYFLTGIGANYAGWYQLNNAILVGVVVFLILGGGHTAIRRSPLLFLYGLLTLISLLSHVMVLGEVGEVPSGVRTMPVVLVAMLASRWLAVRGLFRRVVTLNILPVLVLLAVGGVGISYGRFETSYLNEYQHGWLPQFAFGVGAGSLLEGRFPALVMLAFLTSISFMMLASSRQFSIFILCAIAVLACGHVLPTFLATRRPVRKGALRATIVISGLLAGGALVMLPRMTANLKERFGENFSWQGHLAELFAGDAEDRSSADRQAFIDISMIVAREHVLGIGNANFPYAAAKYGKGRVSSDASHPHSGFAEALITGGYPGLLVYLCALLYLGRIGWKSPVMSVCLVWLFLMIPLAANLTDKIVWPMMAIAEAEIQMSRLPTSVPLQRGRLDRAFRRGRVG